MRMQVGQALREARLNRGLDLYEIQRVTGIRVQDLRAMEEDRWEALPEAVAEERLTAYADFLGLDEGELLEQFRHPGERGRPEEGISAGVIRRGGSVPRLHWRPSGVLMVGGVAALVGVILGLVVVGPLGGSGNRGGGHGNEGTSASSASRTTTTTASPAVSVQFHPTAVVWVCLVDHRQHPVIDGENLAADQTVGPYDGKSFDVTFGNGSVQLTVNGQAVKVPPIAAPLGYRITPDGATRLPPPDQPSCT
jgi:transcriptional regulator with XRE-family HTH domain